MGSLFSAMFITTIQDVGDGIVKDRYAGSRNFFITRPIKPIEYMLGIAISTLTYNGAGGAVMLAICVLFLDLRLFNIFENLEKYSQTSYEERS